MSQLHDRDVDAAIQGPTRDLDRGLAPEGPALASGDSHALLDPRPVPGEIGHAWQAVTGPGRRGGQPRVRSSVSRLQVGAGNAGVARLLDGRGPTAHTARRVGPPIHHAGEAGVTGSEPAGSTPLGNEPAALDQPAQAPAPAVPTSSFTNVGPPTRGTYTVSGTLRQAADAVGGRTEAGSTTATPDLVSADNGTRMVQAQVTVTQAVVLPEWDGKSSATQNQRNEWDRFKAAITAHEDGHVATDVKAFAGAHTKILARKTIAASNTEYDSIVTAADTANATFDTGSDHGRPATNINPNIDEVTKVP